MLQAEFTMSKRQARNFMQTAERFGSKSAIIADLPVTVIYELAAPSPSGAVIEQVESKQIPATLSAIRAAKEAEQRARAEQAALQEQLTREREVTTAQIHPLIPRPCANGASTLRCTCRPIRQTPGPNA
jgi:hypothetical protein